MTEPAPSPEQKRRSTLKPWHLTALQLTLSGYEPKEIAGLVHRKVRIVQHYLASDDAQKQLQAFHDSVMSKIEKDRIDPLKQMRTAIPRAIAKLIAKLDCGDDKTEYLAACRLLDNTGFAPVKRLHISEEEKLSGLTLEEMKHYATTGQLPARMQTIEGSCETNDSGSSQD